MVENLQAKWLLHYTAGNLATEIVESSLICKITLWREEFESEAVGVSKLFPLACSADNLTDGDRPLDQLLGSGSAHQLKIKLGIFLVAKRDQIINGFKLTDDGYEKRAKLWKLEPVGNNSPDSTSHSPLDSSRPEAIKVSQGQENKSSSTAKSESSESDGSKRQPKKNCPPQGDAQLENQNNISAEQGLTDSPDSPPQQRTAPLTEFHLLMDEDDIAVLLDDYLKAEVLALDIETTGLDPLTDQIRLVQIAAKDLPVLIVDLFQCPNGLSALTPLLVNKAVKVIHNAKFDLKFLFKNGVEVKGQIFDTMLADQLLSAGKANHSSSLDNLAQSYLGRQLDKQQQSSQWEADLTDDQLPTPPPMWGCCCL